MTYNSNDRDPAMRNRGSINGTNYTPWIIGGIVVFVLVVGAYVMTNNGSMSNTALNSNRGTTTAPMTPALNSPASTTGSGASTTGSSTSR